ncbi:hypothetical protein GW17_00031919, partial [Ensete ventricosum]
MKDAGAACGVRRGRAQANPVVQAERSSTRRRRAARNQQSVDQNPPATRSPERRAEIGLVEGRGEVGGLGGEEKLEEVGEKKMNDCDSGARSPDKLPGGEDETSTAPLPEKVRHLYASGKDLGASCPPFVSRSHERVYEASHPGIVSAADLFG